MQFRGGMNELMRQASRMQRKIDQVKAEIKDREVTGTAIGDKISVIVTCEGKVRRIDHRSRAPRRAEGLEMALDGVVAPPPTPRSKQRTRSSRPRSTKVTGGIKLPAA